MIEIAPEVRERFPTLKVAVVEISGVSVRSTRQGRPEELDALVREAVEEIRKKYELSTLKDVPLFRAYRDFFWRLGIDPTKDRPSAEALVRRVLSGKPFPAINNLVDAYNVASMLSGIPIATFDADAIIGPRVELRFAREGELFVGIGMDRPVRLSGRELIMVDGEGPIAIYPYRDSDRTKVVEHTSRVLVVACGAPGVGARMLKETAELAAEYIMKFCGGVAKPVVII